MKIADLALAHSLADSRKAAIESLRSALEIHDAIKCNFRVPSHHTPRTVFLTPSEMHSALRKAIADYDAQLKELGVVIEDSST